MEKKIKIFNNFSDQEKEEILFWASQTYEKKLETLEIIRQNYLNLIDKNSRRFQRVYRIIEQAPR